MCQLWLCNHGNILHQHQDWRQRQQCGWLYTSWVTGLFLFIIIYSTDDCLQKTTPWCTGHHIDVPPHITTSINTAHKKKKHPRRDTTGDSGMTGIASRFYIYITFFFLYYRWYLLLQLSQWQWLPFHLPVPSSSSQFGLWKAVMAKIGPNNARHVVWAFSKFLFFSFMFN